MENSGEHQASGDAATDKGLQDQKYIAYYSSVINAWLGTNLELDKNLLTLSAGGVGILLSIITAFGVKSPLMLTLFIGGLFCFTTCIICILIIFNKNADYLTSIIEHDHKKETALLEILKILDKFSRYSFSIGLIIACAIGIITAYTSLNAQENTVSHDEKKTTASSASKITISTTIDSEYEDSTTPCSHSLRGTSGFLQAPNQMKAGASYGGISAFKPTNFSASPTATPVQPTQNGKENNQPSEKSK